MNRAMFSGVAGLKAHQTKMDVIGNNIANVNTYGYKSQRAVFSDIYYQTLRAASAGNASRGGTNPSTVGYGSTLAAVQTQMTQSSMQNTGFGLDVAITGEGFLQVMDADGNIFYTKAGLLDYDANGYLTDINGNFVLGSTTVDGAPGTQKIRLTNLGSVPPTKPSAEVTLNGITYKIEASDSDKAGNVSISLGSSEDLPAGMKATATISSTGAITVQLNAFEKFNNMQEVNDAINQAITEANGGVPHAGGTFTITPSENVFGVDASDATWTGTATNKTPTLTANTGFFGGTLSIKEFNPTNPGQVTGGNVQFTTTTTNDITYSISATVGGETFTGTVTKDDGLNKVVELKSGTGAGTITMTVSDPAKLEEELKKAVTTAPEATATAGTTFLGGATIKSVDKNIDLTGRMDFNVTSYTGGTIGLEVTVNGTKFTGSGSVGGDVTLTDASGKTIVMSFPSEAVMQANLGQTVTDTSLNATKGNHTYNMVAAKPASTEPLTGEQIVGIDFGVDAGTIEGMGDDTVFGGRMTFIKASSDFNGSGTITANDFTATYTEAKGDTPAFWSITMTVNGKDYTTTINEDTVASSLLLKSADGDYVQVSNPGFKGMGEAYEELNPGKDLKDGASMDALTGGDTLTATPSVPSRDLGLGSESFTLSGGTAGGVVQLSDLTNIAIGADGTVSVSHATLGTVAVGKISLANFANTSGLQASGNNYFVATANSGEPKLCDPGTDGTGSLKSSALEMSNVDLSSEMADMITTQRGFQANSRIITVSDTMLEELINLKR